MSITSKSVHELSSMLSKKEISSLELTQAYLDNIEKDNADPLGTNSYITVTPEIALNAAKNADKKIQSNSNGLLTGIPVAIKDIINVKDVPTTCASKIMETYISPYDATVSEKLLHENNMPHLGKLNLDEFAMGSSNETSYYGIVRNPCNKEYSPGGSSGGSAAAVVANLAPVTLATDTGGSIRQPAAFCGCVGFKPTYGRVSRYGSVAFASSLDQIGPIAKSVTDCALIYSAIAGYDPKDSTSSKKEVKTISISKDVRGLRVGIPKEFFVKNLDEEIRDRVLETAKSLEKEGAILSEISIPKIVHSPVVYYIIAPAEASSNLARFDGIRYGNRVESENFIEVYIKTRTEGFGSEVKRRIMLGTFILSTESYDSFFVKAQQVRSLLIEEYDKAFQNIDVVIGPTTPSTAFKIGEKINDPISMYLSDIFTIPANLVGAPSISVPIGLSKENNLPMGLQITAQRFNEQALFTCACSVESMYQ